MEQTNEKSIDTIHSIDTWWLSQKQVETIKDRIRENIREKFLLKRLEEMKVHIQKLPENVFFPVEEAPFVFSTNPQATLLVEDVNRLKLGLACTYRPHDNSYYEPGDEEKLKDLGGLAYPWALCSEEQAEELHNTLNWVINSINFINWQKKLKKYELYSSFSNCHSWNGTSLKSIILYGFTLKGKGEYYRFNDGLKESFNGAEKQLAADLYVSPIPEGTLSLPYILGRDFTPKEGTDPYFWKVLSMLLAGNLVSLVADEENKGYTLEYDEEELSLEVVENLSHGMKEGALLRSYFQLPEVEKKVEAAFEKNSIPPEELFAEVLQSDRLRCDLPVYSLQMLTDPNRGGWDLWETEQLSHEGMTQRKEKESFYARDPRQDISNYGVIGIDFGTKSTVVTYLEDSNVIRPLRIGTGELYREVREGDYENPTVMEFVDLDHFWSAYQARAGRPDTRWEDVLVSHTAANNWKETRSDDCAAFLGELKQWAGTEGKRIHVRDKKGHEKTLPPYITLQDGDFDPIELYAYYIGLYLNNQHMGKIYMRYILSFPVTYAKEVQDHILESFRRGLRKSLPLTVVQDDECMKTFRVEAGAGEPAAYAVCALQELQKTGDISLSDEQPLFYGVFDFGGGTSDFDFGTWRKAKKGDKKEKRYNYVIHHFGAGGKQYLGGENLLKQLAYQVFQKNADLLREKQIPFVRAPECAPFPGNETIVNDSQEAETNTQRLMEKLRPFWERKTETAPDIKLDKMNFFNAMGKTEDNVELQMSTKDLEGTLKNKLKEGIKAFFDKLLQVRRDYSSSLAGTDTCHILLAGRSSQSPLFQKLFNEAKDKYKNDFEKSEVEEGRGIGKGDFFVLHKPLGSQDAKENDQGTSEVKDETTTSAIDFYAPNGKTGVAFGLLQCRKGGKIKVNSETDTTQAEIPFQFYVGEDDDGVFRALLTPKSTYGIWQEFEYAMETDNEFYYTTNPSAGILRGLSCSNADVHRANCSLPEYAVNEDATIYWRPSGPKTLEYVVAENEEKVKKGEYTYGPETILLEK